MCNFGFKPKEELDKLPQLIRDKGWSSTEVREPYTTAKPWQWLQGSTGPIEDVAGIKIMTGMAFQVIADEDGLQVRLNWPGQLTTCLECSAAVQVIAWLELMVPFIERDKEERQAKIRKDIGRT